MTVAQKSEYIEGRLEVLVAFGAFALGRDLVDEVARLHLRPARLRNVAAALQSGREAAQAWRDDAPTRRKDRAARMRFRRQDEVEIKLRVHAGHLIWSSGDGSCHWRFAPRATGRGTPVKKIRAEVRARLITLGIKGRHLRELRERLLDLLSA